MTIPVIAPPDRDDPDEEAEPVAVLVGAWDVVVTLVAEDMWFIDAVVVVDAVESTLKESIGLLAFLLKRCVA